jgi:aminodeoxyfutalosine synthase
VRRRLHGDTVFYNINRHINPTNVCVYTYNCKFCSLRR